MFNIFWPHKNKLSISDIVIFLSDHFNRNKIPHTISEILDPISHNIIIDNLCSGLSLEIEDFCNKYNTKVTIYVSEYASYNPAGFLSPLYSNNYYADQFFEVRMSSLKKISCFCSSLVSIMLDMRSINSYKKFLGISNFYNFVPESNFTLRLGNSYTYDLSFMGTLTDSRKKFLEKLSKKNYNILFSNSFVDNEQRALFLKKSAAQLHIPVERYSKATSPLRVYFGAINGKFTVSSLSCEFTKDFIIDLGSLRNQKLKKTARFESVLTDSES